MSSFLKIQTHEFKDEDDEDEDYNLCDFALKRVRIDLSAYDSNVALHTRSKVTLPDDGSNKRKTLEMDASYTQFLHTMYVDPSKDEQNDELNDEDFDMENEERSIDDTDEVYDQNVRIPKAMLRELNENSNSPNSTKQKNSQNCNKKVTAHLRVPFHALQRQLIRKQLKELFQLLVIVRHLSLNCEKHINAHTLSTQLLDQFNYSRFGGIQSIRFAIAKESGVLDECNRKNMTQQEANAIAYHHTSNLYIYSMMDIEYIDEYFAFNQHCARSYAAVLNRFGGTLLNNDSMPAPLLTEAPILIAKDISNNMRKFTETEERLFGLGAEEYGEKLAQPMISNNNVGINRNIIINDWTSMRDRFLPHKSIESLQKEIAKIRTLNHELRYDYKLRPPSKAMNDIELSLLAQGVQTYGPHSWAKISMHLLPNWTSKELKSRYHKKVKPLIETMQLNVEENRNKVTFFNPSMDRTKNTNSDPIDLCRNYTQNANNNNNHTNDNRDLLQLPSLFCEENNSNPLE